MEWIASLGEPFRDVIGRLSIYLPRLVGALVVVLVGWLASLGLRFILVRLLQRGKEVMRHPIETLSARAGKGAILAPGLAESSFAPGGRREGKDRGGLSIPDATGAVVGILEETIARNAALAVLLP